MKTQLMKPMALAVLLAGSCWTTADTPSEAQAIMKKTCGACHTSETNDTFSRISHQRKTPEGWLMTIARMQTMHGVKISNADRRTLVKYLSDTQGLAPKETEGYRYVLERRLNTQEQFEDSLFSESCARCHSGARVKLQRREADEWEHLAHFHLGHWPSTEYQSLARDRDWFPIILNQVVPELQKQLPMQGSEWKQWQAAETGPVKGNWTVSGWMPGKGNLIATMTVSDAGGDDQYKVKIAGQYADGTPLKGNGTAILYTGYEWRANMTVNGVKMRQVFTVNNGKITGRMFDRNDDTIGLDVSALHEDAPGSEILAVQPGYIRAGTEATLTLVGNRLSGTPKLGAGISVVSSKRISDSVVKVTVKADNNQNKINDVSMGTATGGQLAVYSKIDKINVVPAYAVARIGGNGGSTNKLSASFEAEAWSAGKDGQTGTADDFRIGMVPATWEARPFDDIAAADNDLGFAGRLDPRTGVFSTADAGPNPQRRMMTNNAGHLTVTAQVQDGNQTHSADAELIVTVQRWNNPPIP